MVAIKTHKVSKKWRGLFKLIPDYDPFAQAGDCEFDEPTAERIVDFYAQVLYHVKSTKAVAAGSPFILEPWQQAFEGCLYGWKRLDGWRRYRECFLYLPKKGGKSALMAGNVLIALTQDNECAAEVFSLASAQKQTKCVFDHVAGMIRAQPYLKERLRIYGDKGGGIVKSVVYSEMGSSYLCQAADAGTEDGPSVSFAAVDEIHAHKSPDAALRLKKGTTARPQPLIMWGTTADYNRPSLCNMLLKKAHDVCANGGDPGKPGYFPEFLPVVYEALKTDDWTDPKVWAKANPNLGVTVQVEEFASDVREAAEHPLLLNDFLRFRLNVVTDADVAWITAAEWAKCDGPLDLEVLKGRPCWGGLDLSATCDMTAFVLLFPDDDGGITLLPSLWVPERKIEPNSHKDWNLYETWFRGGYIKTTPGDTIDYAFVRNEINELGKTYIIQDIGVDRRWQGVQLCTELSEGDGFQVTPFGQGSMSMGMPSQLFYTQVVAGTLRHGDCPILRWQASNVMVKYDDAGNPKPSKDKSSGKIDALVSAIMALGVWQIGNTQPQMPSFAMVY